MKTTEAKQFLNVAGDVLERRQVMTAYRRRVFNAHPDRGGDDSLAAEVIEKARQARDVLIKAIDNADCDKCKGTGEIVVRGGFSGTLRCVKCNGRGRL